MNENTIRYMNMMPDNQMISTTSENPVFKISSKSLNNFYEQPNGSSEDNYVDIFKVGDYIKGFDFKKRLQKGKILSIEKNNNGNIIEIKIISSDEKKIKLDPMTCKKIKNKNNQIFKNESIKLKDLNDFLKI